jgi:hypothetical protein
MAYTPNRQKVQHVVVQARANGQEIINNFYLVPSQAGVGGDGSSVTLLTAFRAAYRLVLGEFYDVYEVGFYWMREVTDAMLVAGPPQRWETVYDVNKVEVLAGVLGVNLDEGQQSSVGVQLLPAHEALRVRKIPTVRRIGYFRSAYNRFCPWVESQIGDTWEKWNAGFLVSIQVVLTAFNTTNFLDGGTGNASWDHGVWSATLFGRVIKPAGGPLTSAASAVASYTANPWIGTQVSRRFKPSGLFKGS